MAQLRARTTGLQSANPLAENLISNGTPGSADPTEVVPSNQGQGSLRAPTTATTAGPPPLSVPVVSPLTRFREAGLTFIGVNSRKLTVVVESWSSKFQIFLLKHPNFLTKAILFLFFLYDTTVSAPGVDNSPEQDTLYERKLKYLGPNFPAYGGVMVGDFNLVRQLILSPQKRGPYIAWGKQVAAAYTDKMLLFLSDKAAGGSGEREQIKDILTELLTSEQVMDRGKDEVAQAIVSGIAKEIKAGNPDSLTFATDYILYVVFGIRRDTETTAMVAKTVAGYVPARVWPLGLFKRGLSADEQKVRHLLASSPLIRDADLRGYDRERFVDALMPVLHVAAIPGPATFIYYATTLMPATFKFNYGSDDANLNAVYEAMRTHPPVASVTSFALHPVEIDIAGELHRFPAGTKLMYNLKTASKDPAIHGRNPLTVDVSRPNLAKTIVNFNSVGPENYGRQCPGRKVAEQLGIDLFRNLGELAFTISNKA